MSSADLAAGIYFIFHLKKVNEKDVDGDDGLILIYVKT